ncbi:aldo/keto reductase [Haladaptatus sp. DYF46]|uniref:aldo/keto reductase n=1 Tax=Haladaptatus sp. DYF46 TaxID=2886041 RepID=UPI001E487E8D|nr:aldo/keto reductase [Haladaptatus sp. DYF46]
MEYTTLGETGTTVSRICLGCMGFGGSGSGELFAPWTVDEEQATEVIDRAIELGINFFDTANFYSVGGSEEILGNALSEYDRDELVVATKSFIPMNDDPNSGGLSRKTIEQELDHSLDRLGMETVDLYQIARWDQNTSIEQTLRALDDAVRRGKTRYIGASSMWAHQFAEALYTSDRLGLERFITMQNQYSPIYREEEREMNPLCESKNIGRLSWSPLGGGYLARPHEEQDEVRDEGPAAALHNSDASREINERVQELADDHDVSMAQIGLAWQLSKEGVTAPIYGTTSVEHLEDAVEAVELDLSESDVEYLEEPYEPVEAVGIEVNL